jgi:hypothetical protein
MHVSASPEALSLGDVARAMVVRSRASNLGFCLMMLRTVEGSGIPLGPGRRVKRGRMGGP